ncbi:major facilitator superfamily domain-containing protein [Emericellopsis atlantica]|uniref:Major facilitator superfamily domain-containing protein n=1 Tax=Emericellopsis atlantica TaxID=2614577 RepID=A0A9P8CU50_9HYPO|nr:major facilitator superfamily domain-containing protein [Emericellopsis atlantica]KAG9258795.1 major facilitator superfamily domain-containing protein [Emericellopsis atlantica]
MSSPAGANQAHGYDTEAASAQPAVIQQTRDSTPNATPDSGSHKEVGVSRVEAFNKVLYQSGRKGKVLLWVLGVSIGLTMFAYALDMGLTSSIFSTLASSTFGVHSSLGAVSTASQIIRAISKPFIGKLADITSRPTTYVVILIFYAVGFAVAASATNFASYTVGICFTSVGKSGLDLLSDIIVGDLTPLEWRGFFGATLSLPFVITVPINGFIGDGFVDNWRWGLGMFAILVPALLIPAIFTLYTMQRRGEKAGMVTMADSKNVRTGVDEGGPKGFMYWVKLLYAGLIDIDILGLVILGFAFSLILLPFTLAKSADGGWSNPSMIAMLVMGFVCLVFFILFEIFLAPKPIMTKRILNNRAFLAGVTIYTFNQMASSVRNTYFASYIYIIKDWTTYQWIIFLGITTMGLSLLGPFVGLLQRKTHHYKTMMIFGAVARIIGYGILVQPSGNMTQDTARLVVAQLIYCLSSFNVVGARVGTQASVPHEDMASIISVLTLWSTLGSSVGSAVASAIWTNQMLDQMYVEMPNVPKETILEIYGSITALRTDYDFLDPIRQGSIRAYAIVNGNITVTSLCLACVPLIASFFMPDFFLGKQQNAVTNKGLDGELVDVPTQKGGEEVVEEKPKSTWEKVLNVYRK